MFCCVTHFMVLHFSGMLWVRYTTNFRFHWVWPTFLTPKHKWNNKNYLLIISIYLQHVLYSVIFLFTVFIIINKFKSIYISFLHLSIFFLLSVFYGLGSYLLLILLSFFLVLLFSFDLLFLSSLFSLSLHSLVLLLKLLTHIELSGIISSKIWNSPKCYIIIIQSVVSQSLSCLAICNPLSISRFYTINKQSLLNLGFSVVWVPSPLFWQLLFLALWHFLCM